MQRPTFDKSIKPLLFASMMAATLVLGTPSQFVSADSTTIDFESYSTGTVHTQDGWSSAGAAGSGCVVYDHQVTNNTFGYASFGAKSLRISNAATSGCFSDQTFSKSLVDEAGESSAANDGLSGGTRQPYFEAQWDFASTVPGSEQAGLAVVASPDRGDGARMSWVQMRDEPGGLAIGFYDYITGTGFALAPTTIATGLDRTKVHTIKVSIQFVDGPSNDVVKVYVDGVLSHTGTSWEDYFRVEEGNPTRTVDSILFRTGGTAAPATLGNGFLIDNLTLFSGPVPVPLCTTVCYVDAVNGSDSNDGISTLTAFKTIQKAIDTVQAGGTVRVLPGSYNETATNRFVLGTNGPHQFGLYVGPDKNGISIIGVEATDAPITVAANAVASITTNATNNFGASGIFVEGDNVTVQGLKILNNLPGDNKTIEIIGDGFTLRHTWVNVSPPGIGSVYFGDWRYNAGTSTSYIKSYTVENNLFDQGAQVAISSGAGVSGPLANRKIVNNMFLPTSGQNWPFISFNGAGGVPWYEFPVGGAVITGNTFSGSTQHIRSRGTVNASEFDWASYWTNNTYDKAVVALVSPFDVRSFSYTSGSYTFTNVRRIGAVIQPEVDNAQANDTVLVKAGIYVEQVVVGKSLSLKGESGAASTFINAPATLPAASNPDSTIVKIAGAGVDAELTGFTVAGPGPSNCGSILAGIFVRDGANANIHDNRVLDIRDDEPSGDAPFSGCQNGIGIIVGRQQIGTSGTATIKNNVIAGYQKNGIIVSNTGSNALIDGNTITGFGAQTTIAQNGVQVSAGAVATVQNNTIKDHQCNNASCGPDVISQVQSGGVLLISAGTGTVVKNNLIQANDMGVYSASGDVEVRENNITANRYAGIFVDQGKITLNANEITGASNLGVVVVSYNGNSANSEAVLANNVIKDATEGTKLVDETTSDGFIPVLSGSLNSIAGSTNGLNNTTSGAITVEKNWWGNANGPTNAGNPSGAGAVVAGNVDYDPWLCDGTDTSPSIGFQPNTTPLCTTPGSISLTKVVNWDGAAVNNAQTFQLCVSGSTLTAPICQNFGANGGTQTVSNLPPGNYTITETDPGSAWTVTGNNTTVVVVSNVTASGTITNQLKRGDITITKVVNWSGVAVDNSQAFSICLSGPSFPTPDCKSFGANGGTETWSNVIAGSYTVNEADPGTNWNVADNNATVVLAAGDTANATVTNTFRTASLKITKSVNWSGTPPTAATFQICISGPSYSTPNCKTFSAGQDQTWSPLIPGNYTVTESDPGVNWSVSGTGTVAVAAGSNASTTVTNTFRAASLTVTKTVNWNGAPPASGVTFQICVTGPSFSTPNCKTFTPGQAQTWAPLIPGNYTVNETNPGANWTVTGNGAVVNVAPAQAATARIINVLRPGTLQVVKVVNTNGATGLSQTFSICVTGPSYATPDCKTVGIAGGTLQWSPVFPGSYSVVETAPGGNWTVTGNNAMVTVNPAQTGSTTLTNTYQPPPPAFACSVLDNFNRANGKLGSNWTGDTSDYRVKDNTAYLNDDWGDIILWNRAPATFGANQVACMTLSKIVANSEKHALILKAQGTNASAGMIKVAYVPKFKRVDVWSIQPGQSWVKRATINNVTMVNGDRLGAQALADGSVRVFRNGTLIGTSTTSSYFVNRGGRIGVWYVNAEGARFDDFGGGNFTP